ncbi:MAG: HdeD family acid-resistance protein [Bacteroides sp.]|nr:HdeD family acid-resistance protein [Bacteroides sp.]
MATIQENLNYSVKNWWLSLVIGIVFVLLAILLMFTPISSYITLSILFSIAVFVAGIFEIVFSINNKNVIPNWGWNLGIGIIDLILGFYLMFHPGLSMAVLPYIAAFWLIFRGVSGIAYTIDLKRFGDRYWGWYIAFGILAILLGIWFIFQPLIGAISLVYFISYMVLIFGIFRIMLSFQLRKCKKNGQCEGIEGI